MLKTYFSVRSKRFQQVSVLLVVVIVASIGTYLLISSRAATPYASITANKGSLANGATSKTCSGASSGSCVVFGAASGGPGGGGNNMVVGINPPPGPGAEDLSKIPALKSIRYEADSGWGANSSQDWISLGYKVDVAFGYDVNDNENSGGVSAINITNWVNYATSWYQSNCGSTPTLSCPMLEVLNEPAGSWFWGNNANDQTNATAYANLVKATYIAFHNKYGSSAPLILASYDGGYSGDTSWGQEWWPAANNGGINMSSYVDGVTMHPYGGKTGSRSSVTDSHAQTNKPVYITEVGWPTAVGQPSTGDSSQWPQTNTDNGQGDQCDSVYNFMSWARGTGYVNAVYYFNYLDYGTNDWYGVVDENNNDKPSLQALGAAAAHTSNPCPNPVSY
jgi:hypothetical protein